MSLYRFAARREPGSFRGTATKSPARWRRPSPTIRSEWAAGGYAAKLAGTYDAESTRMIDTKHPEAGGFDRAQAEALAEATNRYIVPDLATKTDLTNGLATLEAKLSATIIAAIHTAQIQSLGIITALLGITVAVIKPL
jgi:hypothetical protein